LRYWGAYVVVTVVFEAWMIGRWMGRSWPVAIGISIIANVVTAFMCTNLGAVFLHADSVNPNPFLFTLVAFTAFGVLSSYIESFAWRLAKSAELPRRPVALQSLYAHLLGVPIGLAILLIPARPYQGIEATCWIWRRQYVAHHLPERIDQFLSDGKARLPTATTLVELWHALPPTSGESTGVEVAAYKPKFGRFSFGRDAGRPIAEWNTALNGKTADEIAELGSPWFIRMKNPNGSCWGFLLNSLSFGKFTSDPAALGYTSGNRDQSPK